MESSFGINTNIFDTNILNLLVVIGIIITIVGDVLRSLLQNRQKMVLSIFHELDFKKERANQKLYERRKMVVLTQFQLKEILDQGVDTLEKERSRLDEQLGNEMQNLKKINVLVILLIRYQEKKFISRNVITQTIKVLTREITVLFSKKKKTKISHSKRYTLRKALLIQKSCEYF